ncbi:MAG: hypothetical protein A3J37_07385 [Alphaproteobacteria bacterium RIFCSPHIGHO2_12_FULL_45_9]|nr:MAG: hypothetical protein A3B66_08525 [Alphaproteobacteria bacterium RIFCSPHIGHO2_02_FULL_46_13]OFW95546.1 MAG: hypothetical protein A3J37_07385 [Alphaproteobacteria bacterium RIFCSPHIGHO2_12_FULL_45_9]
MFSREWNQLDETTKQLIKRYQLEQPMRLGELGAELGLIVKSATLPVGISGEIKPDEEANAGFIIRVNRHEHKNRQRFTLAHELAHYFLHRSEIGSGIQDNVLYRSQLTDKREAEANRLAADILMPWEIIEEKLKQYRNDDIEERVDKIATELGVSTTALNIRLGR